MIIRLKLSRLLLLLAVLFLAIPVAVKAATYASTTIWVNVASDTSFTMQVLGCSATSITGTTEAAATNSTGEISFNATTTSQKEVNAQSITGPGASCTTPTVQNGLKQPIFTLTPAGNVIVNFSIKFSNVAPSDVNFKFNGTLWNATSSGNGGCVGGGSLMNTVFINSSTASGLYQMLARNINFTNGECVVNVTAFANFSSSAPGERKIAELVTNSSQGIAA